MRQFLLIALFSPVCVALTAICPTPLARGDSSNKPVTEWRRTEFGWEETSNWKLDEVLVPVPTPAAAIHPLVIASLELMISVGALAAGKPSSIRVRG